ncbi:S41 family peptidase [Xanthovirga aplysinae]|uniref:S41 family peptidase n=1 Tax=Xanthovirga aplysinae TaxID=2529853 RepID=UPI0012BC5B82|nr:S41 family peptidase [Xanthovirga aplysinae]MTI30644.1 hypothetical protein [Xanthovirga aplysinae]
MRNFYTISLIISTYIQVCAQSTVKLTKEQAQEDLNLLRFSLEYVHPRLYKYDDKKTVDNRFKKTYNSIHGEISGLDFLSLVSKLNASIKCGHLYTIPQYELKKEVLEKKVMPFYIKIINNEFYLFNDCSEENPIPNGSKIISINGKSSDEIYKVMLKGIATDGNIETRKKRLIERYFFYSFHGFDLYYHLHIDRSTTFNIEYQEYQSRILKKKKLKGISIDERKEKLLESYNIDEGAWFKIPSPQFDLMEEDNYGVLTISRSFYDEEIDPNYDSRLGRAFKELKEKNISNLIIDLRNNEGGSEHQQIELISYLYDQPFKLYQNIFLSHLDFRPLKHLIIERDTSELLFNNDDEYMRKLTENLWVNNYEYSRNLKLQTPKENVFNGQLYVLMNGASFSSAADLIAGIKKTTNAIFIGEESGGTFEGPTGGNSIVIQLPNSKIMVRISPNIQIGYMYQKHPIGRGVLPNHKINYKVEDLLGDRDLEMEKAIQLILNEKQNEYSKQ